MEGYYLNQVGNGTAIQSFGGLRYQRGGGFFSRMFVSRILPVLRYLGGKALSTGAAIFDDVKTSATNRIIDAVQDVAQEAIKRKRSWGDNHNNDNNNQQSGEGIKRRKLTKRSYISNYDFLK